MYLPGLSPTLSYASLSIKPALLSLFEDHILTLHRSVLRPALKAIFLALLPGLEEETSEEYERTHSILIDLKVAMSKNDDNNGGPADFSTEQYFWQCLFLASMTSASRRQGALAFMVRNLPHLGGQLVEASNAFSTQQLIGGTSQELSIEVSSAVEAVSSPEPGLLVRSFAAGLQDEHLLVQRGFLDLLVTHLPLHSVVLQVKATREDVDRLVAAAVSVVARREMSLNRRLWTWFLGPEPTLPSQSSTPRTPKHPTPVAVDMSTPKTQGRHGNYFELYSLDSLLRSILKMVKHTSLAPADKARPFRICLSLMDRWEIGSVVVPQLLLPLLESAWLYQTTSPSQESFEEVLRSATVFFDGVESGLIWGEIGKILKSSLASDNNTKYAESRLELILFIVTNFNIREDEMQMIHMPIAILQIVIHLRRKTLDSQDLPEARSAGLEKKALHIALMLLDLVPERAFVDGPIAPQSRGLDKETGRSTKTEQELLDSIHEFYEQYQGSSDLAGIPFSSLRLGQLLLDNVIHIILQDLRAEPQVKQLELKLSILENFTRKLPRAELVDKDHYLQALLQASKDVSRQAEQAASIETVIATTSALEAFSTALPSQFWQISYHTREVISEMVRRLWPFLSPSKPSHNVEAVRCIWRLQSMSWDARLIEGCIATLMNEDCQTLDSGSASLEGARRFATLWAHASSSVHKLHARRLSQTHIRDFDRQYENIGNTPELTLLRRPLMLLLDTLFEEKTELCNFTVQWLRSLPTLHV